VFATAPLDTLVARDVKGLYAKAMRGEIAPFTGISDPYEAAGEPDVTAHTERESVEESAARVLEALRSRGLARS
jgi:adenylylsulfate kinase